MEKVQILKKKDVGKNGTVLLLFPVVSDDVPEDGIHDVLQYMNTNLQNTAIHFYTKSMNGIEERGLAHVWGDMWLYLALIM